MKDIEYQKVKRNKKNKESSESLPGLRIIVTSSCNANSLNSINKKVEVCGFCYRQEDHTRTNKKKLNTILKKLKSYKKIKELTFTGGEPLVYRNLEFLLKEAKALGFNNTIHTNGLLLKKAIKNIAPYLNGISLPIDGASKKTVDSFRGIGFYEILRENLKLVKKYKKELGINTLITKQNIKELPRMAEHINDLNPKYWLISQFREINIAKRDKRYITSKKEFLFKAKKIALKYPQLNIFILENRKTYPFRIWMTLDGKIFIDSNKEKKNISIGNLLNESLDKIINRAISLRKEKI